MPNNVNSFAGFPPWRAWNQVGYFGAGVIETDGEVGTGATPADPVIVDRISLDAFPTNMYAQKAGAPALYAVGLGQRLIIDPNASAGGPFTIQIKAFEDDPALVVIFEEPLVLTAPIPINEDVNFPGPVPLFVGDVSKIQIIGVVPDFDERAVAVNGAAINVNIPMEMAYEREGPWHIPELLAIPATVDLATAAPVGGRITSDTVDLPPLPYLRFPVLSATAGAVFGLFVGKSTQ